MAYISTNSGYTFHLEATCSYLWVHCLINNSVHSSAPLVQPTIFSATASKEKTNIVKLSNLGLTISKMFG
jgi:hypothetical protein